MISSKPYSGLFSAETQSLLSPLLRTKRFLTSSLLTLPGLNFEDVSRIFGEHAATMTSKQNKGYKRFMKEFIHSSQGQIS